MSPHHDELKANAAGYVLGILDAGERRVFEAHLAECGECAAEVASLRPVVGALATAVPQVTPRPEMRGRVLGQVIPSGSSLSSFNEPRSDPERVERSGSPISWLPLAAAVVVAAGAAIYAVQVHLQVVDLQGQLVQAQSATSVLAAPDLARIDLQGQVVAPDARARALWSRTRGLVFSAANLPALPAGKVYQVWVVTAQAPVSAGLLVPDVSGGGTAYYMTPQDIGAPVAVAVTLEPAGGVPAPTGDKYLVGTPAPGV
jgi:anti-sigma-K factor RskA